VLDGTFAYLVFYKIINHLIYKEGTIMKEKIHPKYNPATFTCSCGNKIETSATVNSTHLDICNECHPFYTGKQKLIDSAGRVDRFRKRYSKTTEES
jgi:large subunit ribosomal protein L31